MSNPQTNNILSAVETIIDYIATDKTLSWEALQGGGLCYDLNGNKLPSDGNKRLAMVGDAALKMALMDDCYCAGFPRDRGKQILDDVAGNTNLDRVGKELGLDGHINRRGTGNTGAVAPKTMATTMEAILGAVYYDRGLDAVKKVMKTLGLVPADL